MLTFISCLPAVPEEEDVERSDPQRRTCPGAAGRYPSVWSRAEPWYFTGQIL